MLNTHTHTHTEACAHVRAHTHMHLPLPQYPFNQIKRVNNHSVHFNLDAVCQMVKAKNYHNKLLNIKRDMTNLHEKAAKLKVRQLYTLDDGCLFFFFFSFFFFFLFFWVVGERGGVEETLLDIIPS